jgi:Ca-activated chloride channel homolog
MWGRLEPDKRAKIDIVREVLRPLIANAGQTRIGLTSFGHRRKSDCSDVEVIAAPQADRDLVLPIIDKLSPKGKGPIAEAMRQSAKAIGTARPASILVVTDGADNCQQDACEAAAEIAKVQPGIPIHLVSLAVEPDEIPRLNCVPKATGGRYFDVRDAQSVGPAIEEASRTAMLSPGAPPPASAGPGVANAPPAPQSASAAPGLRLTASLSHGGSILADPIDWRVTKSGGERVREDQAAELNADLEPGTYDVEAALGTTRAQQSITVEPGRRTALTVALNAARVKLRARSAKDADTGATTLLTVAADKGDKAPSETVWLGRGSQGDIVLSPGTYRAAASDGVARQEKSFALTAGTDTEIDLALATGRLELIASAREDGPAIEPVTFTIAEDDPESPDGRREVARSTAATAAFVLPPGTYYISAKSGESETRQRIAIRQGDTVKRTLIVPITHLKVSSLVGGRPAGDGTGIIYRVLSLEGEPREVVRSAVPQLDLALKAGRYRVEAKLGTLNVKAAQDVTEAGKPFEAVLKLDAGEIGLKLPQGSPAGPGDVFWEIRDQAGRPVWHTTLPEPNALLAPGRYTVRLETRDKRVEAAFELKSGEHRAVQLGPN